MSKHFPEIKFASTIRDFLKLSTQRLLRPAEYIIILRRAFPSRTLDNFPLVIYILPTKHLISFKNKYFVRVTALKRIVGILAALLIFKSNFALFADISLLCDSLASLYNF